MASLDDVARLSDVDKKLAAYKGLVERHVKALDAAGVKAVVAHLIEKEAQDQNGRTYTTPAALDFIVAQVGQEVPEDADESQYFDIDAQTGLAQTIVAAIKRRADDFPPQLMAASRLLSECYQAQGDFREAAYALSAFKFDEYRTHVPSEERLQWYVDMCTFFLEADEIAGAAQAVKRAHVLLSDVEKNSELYVQFKTCYARVHDYQRNFIAAAREYHLLSQFYGLVDEGALLESLKYAVTCAILAPAGPERTRRLATLYVDERASQLPNFQMLELMFNERIIGKADAEKFEKLLAPHQNALVASGQTVLQKAIVGHNILAASKIYNNITFEQLGVLLDIHARDAETLVRTMIEGGQMTGTIDQIEGLVEFENSTGSLLQWDDQIRNVCIVTNEVLEVIGKRHPQYRII